MRSLIIERRGQTYQYLTLAGECQIDKMVYELYGLPDNEIKIVEEFGK